MRTMRPQAVSGQERLVLRRMALPGVSAGRRGTVLWPSQGWVWLERAEDDWSPRSRGTGAQPRTSSFEFFWLDHLCRRVYSIVESGGTFVTSPQGPPQIKRSTYSSPATCGERPRPEPLQRFQGLQ